MTAFEPELYKELLLFLATAGVVAPLFRRLNISPVLGFLGAGVLLGPFGLGTLAHQHRWLSFLALGNREEIEPVAEFGIVFLLFMIGLSLSWERLARMRRLVFGLGAAQVFCCAMILSSLALSLGANPSSALILGFAFSLSSTAIIIPVLAERKRLTTSSGKTIFSVLLFQDLMVAPLLFMVTMLGAQTNTLGTAVLTSLLPAVIGLSLIVLVGRVVIRPLFHHVATAGSTEFFMAACLFTIIGTSVLSAICGLSMGLGAFIAGILLAETEYRREIEVTIEPFKGLFLGLFFVSIGADLDLGQIFAAPLRSLALAFGLVAVKSAVTFLVAIFLSLKRQVALETAIMLAPGGEFAFVMLNAAIAAKTIAADVGADAEIAVTLSMFLIPAFGVLISRLILRRPADNQDLALPLEKPDEAMPGIILIGFGRVGRLVGDMLKTHGAVYLAVDSDATLVRARRKKGTNVIWGNATRLDFLHRCGLAEARALIITMDAPAAAEEIVRNVRAEHPNLTIVARARDAQHAALLYKLGVTDAVPETIEASLQLSEAALIGIGIPMGLVIASIHEKRDEFRKMLQPIGPAQEKRAIKMSTALQEGALQGKPK